MINIAKPIISDEEIEAVTEVLKSGMLAQGPKVEEFQNEFSQYVELQQVLEQLHFIQHYLLLE